MDPQTVGTALCIAGGLSLYLGALAALSRALGGPLADNDDDDKWSN